MDDICFSNANHIDSFCDKTRRRFYYIDLIGLKGLQPYSPVRVLQQFGQAQVIPLWANMRVSEISFGPNFEVPRSREILHKWNNILTIDIENRPEREISEYQVWLREDHHNMSLEGEQCFEDIRTTIWIRHSYLGTKVITPEMWGQMETIIQYLDNAGAGPSNIGASFSLPPLV
ncbi:hypothetical protein KY284_013244 [Solanum tuberosum]|nr:hypothetical protein KY284_013244 [Solanum tuberosum]